MVHPGTDGEVYGPGASAGWQDDRGWQLFSYDQSHCVKLHRPRDQFAGLSGCRLDPGSGALTTSLIAWCLTTNNESVNGGTFTVLQWDPAAAAFALVNTNGQLDSSSFNSAQGFNDTVSSVWPCRRNGQIRHGGNFTQYKGLPASYIRAAEHGMVSFDTSFNAGIEIDERGQCPRGGSPMGRLSSAANLPLWAG